MDKWEELIEGCKKNDRNSQEKLYKQFFPAYYALCRKFFSDKHDALTALNNGMLNLFKNIETYDPQKGDLFNWGYSIVRYAALTQVKKQLALVPLANEHDLQIAEYLPDNHLSPGDETGIFSNLLPFLPITCRTICQLFYFEDYSIKEICTALELKEGTVKWYLNDARTRLKLLIENQKKSNHA